MPSVVIADQSEFIRSVVRQVLEHAGFAVAEAASYSEFCEQLLHSTPDVVLLDCLFGGHGGGLGLLRELRATPRTQHIPVVITTTMPDPAMDSRLRNCGATAYLLKPYSPRDLLQAVVIAGAIEVAADNSAVA